MFAANVVHDGRQRRCGWIPLTLHTIVGRVGTLCRIWVCSLLAVSEYRLEVFLPHPGPSAILLPRAKERMRSKRYPFLIFTSEVPLRNSVGIVENENGRFKPTIVLAKVSSILLLIPFRSHSWSQPRKRIVFILECQDTCMYLELAGSLCIGRLRISPR
jgi:hypothetical protein